MSNTVSPTPPGPAAYTVAGIVTALAATSLIARAVQVATVDVAPLIDAAGTVLTVAICCIAVAVWARIGHRRLRANLTREHLRGLDRDQQITQLTKRFNTMEEQGWWSDTPASTVDLGRVVPLQGRRSS